MKPHLYSSTETHFERMESEGHIGDFNRVAVMRAICSSKCDLVLRLVLPPFVNGLCFLVPDVWNSVSVGLSAINGRATTRYRMAFCSGFLFPYEEANLYVIADVVEILKPSALPSGLKETQESERRLRLPKRGGGRL